MLAVIIGVASFAYLWCADSPQYISPWAFLFLALLISAIVEASSFACAQNYGLPVLKLGEQDPATDKQHQNLPIKGAVLCLAVFTLVQFLLNYSLTPDNRILVFLRRVKPLNWISPLLPHSMTQANRIPAYWRSVNLLSGVSPLLPQLLLLVGLYIWFWFTLRGLAHFGDDRPNLPLLNQLPNTRVRMFSQEVAGNPVENEAVPFEWNQDWAKTYLARFFALSVLTVFGCALALGGSSLRTLGELLYGRYMFVWICLCITIILTDALQLWRVWSTLHGLLVYLDRLPLRRTLRALKGLDWGSIWRMSGNVLDERYRMITLQFESFTHLKNTVREWVPETPADRNRKYSVLMSIRTSHPTWIEFGDWYVDPLANKSDLTNLHEVQDDLASIAGYVMGKILLPAWGLEKDSLLFGRSGCERKGDEGRGTGVPVSDENFPAHVRAAEEFFVLPYLAFIQNIFGRIRTLILGILGCSYLPRWPWQVTLLTRWTFWAASSSQYLHSSLVLPSLSIRKWLAMPRSATSPTPTLENWGEISICTSSHSGSVRCLDC